jgi:hypothetical protein
MPRSGDAILYKGDRFVLYRPAPNFAFSVTNSMTPSLASRNAVAQLTWNVIIGGYIYDFDKHLWREKVT